MDFRYSLEPARFLERPNRFLVLARLGDGHEVRVHCADPGRLQELLFPGVRLYVSPAMHNVGKRSTTHDLRFVEHPVTGGLVSLDSRLPNHLVAEALAADSLASFQGNSGWTSEVSGPLEAGNGVRSRFDFCVSGVEGRRCWVEVKSVTLVEERVARFPDAPTVRGRRHVEELTHITELTDDRTAVLFVVQRADADRVEPHWTRDPDFARALDRASCAGVKLLAYTCDLTLISARLDKAIPVNTAPPECVSENLV